MSISPRKHTIGVDVGGVIVGGGAPIVVQSMTNTDTADIDATVKQVGQLWRAGSELVRITVDRDESAAAVPHIRDKLAARGINCAADRRFPLYRPQAADRSSGLRRGAGEVPDQSGQCRLQGEARHAVLDADRAGAASYGKPVRIGVNWGSLDEELLTRLMDENAVSPNPVSAAAVQREAIIQSALLVGAAGRRDRARARPHHPLDQGVGRPEPDRGLSGALGALRLRAASRAHRGGHGIEGHRRVVRRDGHPAAAGDRRHHPRLADARARRRPHAGSARGAGAAADHGLPPVPADRRGLPRLRPHHQRDLPGAGQGNPGQPHRPRCRTGKSAIPASSSSRSR